MPRKRYAFNASILTEKDLQRFWSKVKRGDNGECWLWLGPPVGRDKNKYGKFYVGSFTLSAHRASYAIRFGRVPKRLDVMHKCDNGMCVNPSHLKLGTHLQNMRDMYKKNRRQAATADTNSKTKFSNAQVADIREKVSLGVRRKTIAAEYGIDLSWIWKIVTNRVRAAR